MLTLLLTLLTATAGEPPLAQAMAAWLPDPAERAATAQTCGATLAAAAGRLGQDPATTAKARARLEALVLENLAAKAAPARVAHRDQVFPVTQYRILQQVCAFEAWKLETFVSSGVFPKKYFGYLDGSWDTWADELLLRDTVDRAVPLANAELARRGHAFRLTDQEVIATWLAEGGTLLLGSAAAREGRLDPIMDIGLDSIVRGYASWMPLIEHFDATFGTDMAGTVVGDRYRSDYDLRESILGTILMLCDERMLLARKLAKEGRAPQEGRPLDQQFILGSLHYNSGLLFSEGRVAMLRDFATGDYLYGVSEKTADRRPRLAVLPPSPSFDLLVSLGEPYPVQWTSWNAVYHVLQRYGGWKALGTFTPWFTPEGELAPWTAPAPDWPPPTR